MCMVRWKESGAQTRSLGIDAAAMRGTRLTYTAPRLSSAKMHANAVPLHVRGERWDINKQWMLEPWAKRCWTSFASFSACTVVECRSSCPRLNKAMIV